jgi:hypothetical protein
MDFQHFSGSTRRFEIFAAVVTQTKVQSLTDCGLLDNVGVPFELIANCGSNEIGPVGVKALLHHEIDLTEVNVTEIDRDLLAVSGFWAKLMHIRNHALHPGTICLDGIWMVRTLCARATNRTRHLTTARPALRVYELTAKRILEAAKWRVQFRAGRHVSIGSDSDIEAP